MVVMTERRDQLVRIAEDLEKYIQAFCPCPPGKPTDFVGEKCNDAFLMLLSCCAMRWATRPGPPKRTPESVRHLPDRFRPGRRRGCGNVLTLPRHPSPGLFVFSVRATELMQ